MHSVYHNLPGSPSAKRVVKRTINIVHYDEGCPKSLHQNNTIKQDKTFHRLFVYLTIAYC